MSDAILNVQERGMLLPPLRKLTMAINASGGWRMTSGWRPCGPLSPTHSRGMSIDVAPITYQRGGFWLNTARRLLEFAKAAVPEHNWATIAEADHIHISLANKQAYGLNFKGRTRMFDAETGKEQKVTIMSNILTLEDQTWGDALTGDAQSGDALSGDALSGDYDESGDASDTIGFGDARLVNSVLNPANNRARRLVSQMTPQKRAAVQTAAMLRKVNDAFSLPYEFCRNGIVRSSSTGDRKMNRREAVSVHNAIFALPPCAPRTFPLTFDAPSQTWWINVTRAYSEMLGITAAGASVAYPGGIIIITANSLSVVPDASCVMFRRIPRSGGLPAIENNTNVQLNATRGGGISTRIFFANAQTVNARTAIYTPDLTLTWPLSTSYPIPASDAGILIQGVPSTYAVSFAPFNATDTFTNDYMRNLPG